MTNELHLIDPKKPETFMVNPYAPFFEKVGYEEGVSSDGSVKIINFTVPDDHETQMYNLGLIKDTGLKWIVPPGEYTQIIVGGVFMMSDTPAESWDHLEAAYCAKGNVLVNGLGLGFYLAAIQQSDEVDQITVVERSAGVIELVGPYFPDVKIIHGNALDVRHSEEFDFAWHDIWPTVSDDNLADMMVLENRYGGKSWSRDLILEKIDEGYF